MKKIFSLILIASLALLPIRVSPVFATVNTTTSKVIYSGDGVTTTFAFSFNIFAKTDLVVQELTAAGTYLTLTLTTDYTVSTSTFPGNGNVVLQAGGGYPTIPSGAKLIISRQLPLTQSIAISDNSPTPAATTNQAYDRAVMIAQQLQEQISRVVIQPISNSTQITLPSPTANLLLGWDPTGTFLTNVATIPGTLSLPIADSNLQTIATAGKVSGAAITSLSSVPSGAGVIPIANVASGTANGSKFIRDDSTLQAIAAPITGSIKNLKIDSTGNTTATVTADEIEMGSNLKITTLSKTLDASTTGANSLDTGTLANTTVYYVWAIEKSSDGTAGVLASLSSTAPTMPAGYDTKVLLDATLTDGSAHFVGWRTENRVHAYKTSNTAYSGTPGSSWVSIDTTKIIPSALSTQATFILSYSTSQDGKFTNDSTVSTTVSVSAPNRIYVTAATGANPEEAVTMSILTANTVYVQGSGNAVIYVDSYNINKL